MFRLSTSIKIQASRDTVFRILQDIENYPRYFQCVRQAKILERSPNTIVAEIDETIHGLDQHLRTRFQFTPPDRIEAEQLKGPFQSAHGWFLLTEIDEGTKLEHVAEFAIGLGIIGKLLHRFIADSYAQDRMAEEMDAIKRAAEKQVHEV